MQWLLQSVFVFLTRPHIITPSQFFFSFLIFTHNSFFLKVRYIDWSRHTIFSPGFFYFPAALDLGFVGTDPRCYFSFTGKMGEIWIALPLFFVSWGGPPCWFIQSIRYIFQNPDPQDFRNVQTEFISAECCHISLQLAIPRGGGGVGKWWSSSRPQYPLPQLRPLNAWHASKTIIMKPTVNSAQVPMRETVILRKHGNNNLKGDTPCPAIDVKRLETLSKVTVRWRLLLTRVRTGKLWGPHFFQHNSAYFRLIAFSRISRFSPHFPFPILHSHNFAHFPHFDQNRPHVFFHGSENYAIRISPHNRIFRIIPQIFFFFAHKFRIFSFLRRKINLPEKRRLVLQNFYVFLPEKRTAYFSI